MNIVPRNLYDMLKKAALGGLNKDCVLVSNMAGSSVITLDESSSVYCHAFSNESLGDNTIGLGQVDVLIRYLSGLGTDSIVATVQDNRLVFTNEKTNFRYLLSDPATIKAQIEDIPQDGEDFNQTYEECPFFIDLTDEDRAFITKMMGIAKPRTVTIAMSQSGRIRIEGGGENEHTFDKILGQAQVAEGKDAVFTPLEMKFYGDFIKRIFDELTAGLKTTMYLSSNNDTAAFTQDGVLYNVKPIVD